MTTLSFVTDGFGTDSVHSNILLEAFAQGAAIPTGASLTTDGFGSDSTNSILLLEAFGQAFATQSATVCTTTSWSGYSLQENQTPVIAIGDTFYADYYTTPGHYAVTVAGDGTVTVDALGDTTRQRFQADIFSVSAGANIGAFTVYINNHGPQIAAQPADVAVLTNNAMTAINFTPTDPAAVVYIFDQDNDPITGAQISGGLPVGVTFAGNILSGTPTTAVSNPVIFRFTDTVGDYVDCTINYVADVGAIVPNVVGLTQAEASATLAGVGLLIAPTSTSSYNASVPAGNIISQSVSAGYRVFTTSSINLVVSLGAVPTTAVVPDLSPFTVTVATTVLTAANLVLAQQTVASGSTAGTIISQSPPAGSNVAAFSTVTAYVASGPPVAGDTSHIHIGPRKRHTSIRR